MIVGEERPRGAMAQSSAARKTDATTTSQAEKSEGQNDRHSRRRRSLPHCSAEQRERALAIGLSETGPGHKKNHSMMTIHEGPSLCLPRLARLVPGVGDHQPHGHERTRAATRAPPHFLGDQLIELLCGEAVRG